jgi:hypothetical protein
MSVSFLAPNANISMSMIEHGQTFTFQNREKTNDHKGILVYPSHVVLDVTDREAEGVKFILTSCN